MYIPDNIRQTALKYALGEYVIHPDYENNQALELWVKDLQFEQCESEENRMQLHSRKRNNLYSFQLPAAGKEVVLKVSQISEHYRWYRKLNLMLVGLIKNYSLSAYYGGIALEKINVDSMKVIAHWTCNRQTQSKKSYLLYEKVNASMSVFDLCVLLDKHNSNANKIITQITESLAEIIRKIHKNKIRHGDPHAGNFLLNTPVHDAASLTPSSVEQMRFTLIDLDKIQFVRTERRWQKKLFDIRCIRRFQVHNITSNECLSYYLEKKPSVLEKAILRFWMKGGFNIYKWIKPGKKRH